MQFKKSDFYYDLPEELIAQTPAEPRDSSRLLVYDRKNKNTEHKIFRDVIGYLEKGDVLVLNNTKVLPARLFAHTENGGAVEVLLLKRLEQDGTQSFQNFLEHAFVIKFYYPFAAVGYILHR